MIHPFHGCLTIHKIPEPKEDDEDATFGVFTVGGQEITVAQFPGLARVDIARGIVEEVAEEGICECMKSLTRGCTVFYFEDRGIDLGEVTIVNGEALIGWEEAPA